MEMLNEIFSEANIFPSALMVLVLGYWLLMIFGVVGLDLFDIDVDVDTDLGVDADFDLDLDPDASAATAGGTQVSGSTTSGDESFLKVVLDFFYLSDIPIVMLASAFVFGWWASSLLTNHIWNPEQHFLRSLVLLVPNLIFAAIFTRLAMMPLVSSFRKTDPEDLSRSDLYGRIGRVTSQQVTERYGQIDLTLPDSAELRLNARCRPGSELARGDAARIVSYNHHDGTFLVELTKWENTSDE